MKKQSILFLLLVAVIGIVGLTVAYFSSTTTFENEFQTPEYGTTYIEKFTSPDNWLPGDETEKTLEVTNSGNVDEAVRVKVEESWISKNGTTLLLKQGDNVAADIHWINEDDWTKVTVDGEDYYYYYYNYKLAPEETTNKLLDKVTFNPLIDATTSCSDTVVDGVITRTCNSDGTGYDGATYTLKFTIETVQYNKYREAWNTSIVIKEEKPHPGTLTLLEKTNPISINTYTDGNIHEMYTFEQAATKQTEALIDYRYIGNDPYNYVYFNCDSLDNQNSSTCETWRIIGVFDIEREIADEENLGEKKTITETRMKIIRGNEFSSKMYWNTSSSNDWTSSSLNQFLNETYFDRLDSAKSYGLKFLSREMVDDAIFYLGSNNTIYGSTEQIYSFERGNAVCGACNGDTNKLRWQGKVALMYPSDEYMVYAGGVNDTCYTNPSNCSGDNAKKGWLYNSALHNSYTWFLYAASDKNGLVFHLGGVGNIGGDYVNISSYLVRPVVYLSADIQIIDGDGSSGNPYKLTY